MQRAVADTGYTAPTPIQAQAIPHLLAGRDVLGCAQTGTGKTAAFALPVLQKLAAAPAAGGKRRIRSLVLTPTRELAAQIGESLAAYGKYLSLTHHVIFGGVNEKPQIAALRRGLDILVATPGRLLDLHGRDYVDLRHVGFFVLDEADRMLDMGFIHDVRRVLRALPARRQNLLFSATLEPSITDLAGAFLHDPVSVAVTPPSTTVEKIAQTVWFVAKADKRRLLADLLQRPGFERAIVFTRTKHGANRLAQQLGKAGIGAVAIHGNKSQGARTRALAGFKAGDTRVLIATDLASRGLDIDEVSHVVNFDLPNIPESYVHRIGRTARAGRDGQAISFCDPSEGEFLRDIEREIGQSIPVITDHDWHCEAAVPPPAAPRRGRGQGGGKSGGKGGRKRGRRKPTSPGAQAPAQSSGGAAAPAPRPRGTSGWRTRTSPRRNRRRH